MVQHLVPAPTFGNSLWMVDARHCCMILRRIFLSEGWEQLCSNWNNLWNHSFLATGWTMVISNPLAMWSPPTFSGTWLWWLWVVRPQQFCRDGINSWKPIVWQLAHCPYNVFLKDGWIYFCFPLLIIPRRLDFYVADIELFCRHTALLLSVTLYWLESSFPSLFLMILLWTVNGVQSPLTCWNTFLVWPFMWFSSSCLWSHYASFLLFRNLHSFLLPPVCLLLCLFFFAQLFW